MHGRQYFFPHQLNVIQHFFLEHFRIEKPILWSYTPYASKRTRIWAGVKNANWLEEYSQPHRISI